MFNLTVKCKNGDTERVLGDTFSVKTPTKSADVVIAIDQIKENEVVYNELIQPLVQQLTPELASKGITDVNYHVIGYGGDYEDYPSHITVGGKLTTKDKLPQVKFSEAEKDEPIANMSPSFAKFFNNLISIGDDLDIALGYDSQSHAYREAARYPFRVEASKVLIAVTGQPCRHGRFLLVSAYLMGILFKCC